MTSDELNRWGLNGADERAWFGELAENWNVGVVLVVGATNGAHSGFPGKVLSTADGHDEQNGVLCTPVLILVA